MCQRYYFGRMLECWNIGVLEYCAKGILGEEYRVY